MDPDQVYRLNGTIGGATPTLQARVKTQGTNHKVQLRLSPADGGQMKSYCEMVLSSGRPPTTEKPATTSEPKREHLPTRSVKRTRAIARMKSRSIDLYAEPHLQRKVPRGTNALLDNPYH